MSAPVGEGLRPSVHESLPYLESLHTQATGVVRAIKGVWQRPGEAGLSRERNSMWRAMCLDWLYEQGLQPSLEEVGPLGGDLVDSGVLYQVERWAWATRTLLPFGATERESLQACDVLSSSGDEISAREPELFEWWCQWVWASDRPPAAPFKGDGRAAVYTLTASDLIKSLARVLEDNAKF